MCAPRRWNVPPLAHSHIRLGPGAISFFSSTSYLAQTQETTSTETREHPVIAKMRLAHEWSFSLSLPAHIHLLCRTRIISDDTPAKKIIMPQVRVICMCNFSLARFSLCRRPLKQQSNKYDKIARGCFSSGRGAQAPKLIAREVYDFSFLLHNFSAWVTEIFYLRMCVVENKLGFCPFDK